MAADQAQGAAADLGGQRAGAREPGGQGDDDRQGKDGAQRDTKEREQLVVHRGGGRLTHGLGERVEVQLPTRIEHHEQQGDAERDAERTPEDGAAAVAGEGDRDPEGEDGEDGQHVGRLLQQVGDALDGFQLRRGEQGDLWVAAGVVGEDVDARLLEDALDLLGDRAEGDRDVAVLRADTLAFPSLEEGDDLWVCAPVDLLPQVGELVGLREPDRGLVHELLEPRRDRRRDERRLGRERVGDRRLDVDLLHERVRDAVGEGLLHVGVVGERRDRLDVAVGVEQRGLHPHAEDGEWREDATDYDQEPDEEPTPRRKLRLRLRLGVCVAGPVGAGLGGCSRSAVRGRLLIGHVVPLLANQRNVSAGCPSRG